MIEFKPREELTTKQINRIFSCSGLTRCELARLLSVQETTIFKWVSGRALPQQYHQKQIAEFRRQLLASGKMLKEEI